MAVIVYTTADTVYTYANLVERGGATRSSFLGTNVRSSTRLYGAMWRLVHCPLMSGPLHLVQRQNITNQWPPIKGHTSNKTNVERLVEVETFTNFAANLEIQS